MSWTSTKADQLTFISILRKECEIQGWQFDYKMPQGQSKREKGKHDMYLALDMDNRVVEPLASYGLLYLLECGHLLLRSYYKGLMVILSTRVDSV